MLILVPTKANFLKYPEYAMSFNSQSSGNPVQEEPYPPAYDANDPTAFVETDADALIEYIISGDQCAPSDQPSASPVHAGLPLPLCLPQISSGPTSLFVRAYSPALSEAGVSMDVWLRFMYVSVNIYM